VNHTHERVPVPAALVAALGAALFILPLVGLLWKAPWGDLAGALREPEALMAMRLSLVC
jgi:molybdate transport system permease protein